MMPTHEDQWRQWFESVWKQREEVVYPTLFGPFADTIHTLSASWFQAMGFKEVDPRWLTHGVLVFPPHAHRDNWLYVTSGLSNPWGVDPAEIRQDQYSGLGFEFFMQTVKPAPWAIEVLSSLMAMQILAAQELVDGGLLEPFDRVPLGRTIDGSAESLVRNVLILPPEHVPTHARLHSGVFDLFLCVGITDAEMQFARAQDGPGLQKLLLHHGYLPVTDAARRSSVESLFIGAEMAGIIPSTQH
ncbi:MAG: suppressor of fused domain protein [Phycisphaerae bacterium]